MIHKTFQLHSATGVELFAQTWSPDENASHCVGIIHGLGDHSTRFAPMAKTLVDAGIEVFSYDQLGHGKTGGAMPKFEVLVEDIDVLLKAMSHYVPERRFLFGQSLGGGEVIYHALRKKPNVGGVIAASPLLTPSTPPPAWKIFVGRTLGKFFPRLTLPTGINAQYLTHDPVEVARYENDKAVLHHVSAALGISMLEAGQWSLQHADALSTKMLLIHGSEDQVTSPRSSEAFASKAGSCCELKIWEGRYHDLHFETNRDEVLQYIVNWIHSESKVTAIDRSSARGSITSRNN